VVLPHRNLKAKADVAPLLLGAARGGLESSGRSLRAREVPGPPAAGKKRAGSNLTAHGSPLLHWSMTSR
jgi:hypothetical protein